MGIHPDSSQAPVILDEDAVATKRREHVFSQVWPIFRDTARSMTREPGNILFASDENGYLLWISGEKHSVRAAERAHLVTGALWNESVVGTSAVGTALALDRPFQVFGAEHYLSVATSFICAAVPVRDPMTGKTLGTIDLTSDIRTPQAAVLSLVLTAARLAEAHLREEALREQVRMQQRYIDRLSRLGNTKSALISPDGTVIALNPPGWLPRRMDVPLVEGPAILPGGQAVHIERLTIGGPMVIVERTTTDVETVPRQSLNFNGLGLDRPWLSIDGYTHKLSTRHGEILAVLAAHPGGLHAEDLAREVYGPNGKPVTVRAELARLRKVLGYRLSSDPYRLTGDVHADFLALEHEMSSASLAELLDRYSGPLLPRSTSPGVVKLRQRLHERLRVKVQHSGDADAIARWASLIG